MKRLKNVALFMTPVPTDKPIREIALAGNVFCQVCNATDVRRIATSLADANIDDPYYIEATYCDGSREMIAPLQKPTNRPTRSYLTDQMNLLLAS